MPETPDTLRGRLFEIQRFSIHDGPGIRTTVFLQGCPLRCKWCHNPEGISSKPLLSFLPEKCIGCGYCFAHCPHQAHSRPDGKHVLDRAKCNVCGACAAECYASALELVGREATVDEVLKEVLRDKPFYDNSGGGLTISGGEPLLQVDFTEALLQAAKAVRLHCCVETCGFGDFSRLERVRPYVDLFLYDLKETDDARHVDFTGVSNATILANLRRLHATGAAILLRLPLIGGFNARPEHFEGVAGLVKELPQLRGVQLMFYHALGESKVRRFGLDAARRAQAQPPDPETCRRWIKDFAELGVKVLNTE